MPLNASSVRASLKLLIMIEVYQYVIRASMTLYRRMIPPATTRASRPAERLQHPLLRQRRLGIGRVGRLILVRLRQHRQQFLEWRVIVVDGGGNHRFDAVVARDEGGVDRAHCG